MSFNQHTPCVILPGIGQSKVELVNADGDKIKMAWPLDVEGEDILDALKMPLAKMMLLRRDAGFSDKVKEVFSGIADPIATLPDGSMKNKLRVVSYPRSLAECEADEKRYIYKMVPLQMLSERIGEENLFFFSYNSFGDTYEIAEELSDFIDMVKEKTGSGKVNLVPVSLGGALSTAYFRLFRHKKDIKRVMYFVAALGGSHLIADIMEKNIIPENGVSMIEMLTDKGTADKVSGFLKLLPNGVFEATINKALDALKSSAFFFNAICFSSERYCFARAGYLSGGIIPHIDIEFPRTVSLRASRALFIVASKTPLGRSFIKLPAVSAVFLSMSISIIEAPFSGIMFFSITSAIRWLPPRAATKYITLFISFLWRKS